MCGDWSQVQYHLWAWMGGAYRMEAAFEGDTRLFADTVAHELAAFLTLPESVPLTVSPLSSLIVFDFSVCCFVSLCISTRVKLGCVSCAIQVHFEPAGKETDEFWKVFFLDSE